MRFSWKFMIIVLVAGVGVLMTIVFTEPSAPRQEGTTQESGDYLRPDSLLSAERGALLAQAAAERRFDRVNPAEVIEFLLRRRRITESVSFAGAAAARRPETIGAIAGVLEPHRETIVFNKALPAALAEMRAGIDALPRQEKARAAYALLTLELTLNQTGLSFAPTGRGPEPLDRRALLGAFAREYRGTVEAELADLEALLDRDYNEHETVLTRYARDHPGTVAGAKALYLLGESKGRSSCCGSPINGFMEIVRIIAELESGRFPPCEWVDRAPSLIGVYGFQEFGVRQIASSDDAGRMVGVYKEFVLKHLDPSAPAFDSVESIFIYQFPHLLRAWPVFGGMDRIFDDLIRSAADPDAVRYLRARYDYRHYWWWEDSSGRAAAQSRSNRTLEALSLRADSHWRQRALADLASQLLLQRDYKAAAGAYRRYLNEFPDSDWTWVAAIQFGQAQAESREFEAARQSFRAAASTYASRPVARLVAHAFAAQSSAALGEFEAELADLKLAIEGWDPAFGPSFEIVNAFVPRPGVSLADFEDELPYWLGMTAVDLRETLNAAPNILTMGLRRKALSARVEALTARLTQFGGRELEVARWRFDHADWDGALAILERLLDASESPIRAEAITLARRARLERALASSDVAAPESDQNAAAREFEALAAEAQDFSAGSARIARAALAWRQKKPDDARRWMREGMEVWRRDQQNNPAPVKGSLEDDVLAIREAVIRWSNSAGHEVQFRTASSVTTVTLSGEQRQKVAVNRPVSGWPGVLVLDPEHEWFLFNLMIRFDASPDHAWITPGQPGSASGKLPALIMQFLPLSMGLARPWHWNFVSDPAIDNIDFKNERRDTAEVSTSSGSTTVGLLFEKRYGVWTFARQTFWGVED